MSADVTLPGHHLSFFLVTGRAEWAKVCGERSAAERCALFNGGLHGKLVGPHHESGFTLAAKITKPSSEVLH